MSKTKDSSFDKSRALAALQQLKEPQHVQQEEQESPELHEQQVQMLEDEDRSLPSRTVLFPSNYGKLTKWFYNLLFILFFALFILLLVWGRQMVAEG